MNDLTDIAHLIADDIFERTRDFHLKLKDINFDPPTGHTLDNNAGLYGIKRLESKSDEHLRQRIIETMEPKKLTRKDFKDENLRDLFGDQHQIDFHEIKEKNEK